MLNFYFTIVVFLNKYFDVEYLVEWLILQVIYESRSHTIHTKPVENSILNKRTAEFIFEINSFAAGISVSFNVEYLAPLRPTLLYLHVNEIKDVKIFNQKDSMKLKMFDKHTHWNLYHKIAMYVRQLLIEHHYPKYD